MGFLDETGLSSFFTKLKTAYFNHMVSDTTFQTVLTDYLKNNGTTTAQGYALDARYGKTLKDSVDSLNSNKVGKTFSSTDLTAYLQNNGITTANGYALDARYGKTLADEISALNSSITTLGNRLNVKLKTETASGEVTTSGGSVTLTYKTPSDATMIYGAPIISAAGNQSVNNFVCIAPLDNQRIRIVSSVVQTVTCVRLYIYV